MKVLVWIIAILAFVSVAVLPSAASIALAVIAALAWGYLFTVDHLEHRR